MYSQRYYKWQLECYKIKVNHRKKMLLGAAAVIAHIDDLKKKNKIAQQNKKYWVDPLWCLRGDHGFYNAIYPVVSLSESHMRNYIRMSLTQFESLLCKVGPLIVKQNVIREPISPGERLVLTLRFLATGDSMGSTTYSYLVGKTTACNIVEETCQAIWDCLHQEMLPSTLDENEWLKKAQDFEDIWNFPHCCGAIDGKHVAIQSPDNTGSEYYNYKGFNSINLLAICDANYLFTFVDIGACGRRHDSGVYNFSSIGQGFNNGEMQLPVPESLSPGSIKCPYVIVGDEAFPLKDYLMRPYPGRGGLVQEKIIYNYRLSRARRTIENTFGIMVSQWRILKQPIIARIPKTIKIVQAITCLHNYLRKEDIGINDYAREDMLNLDERQPLRTDETAFQECSRLSPYNTTVNANLIRSEFCRYFNKEGAVPWQYDHC